MGRRLREADSAWLIGLIALGLMVWGVIEFLQIGTERPIQIAEISPAAEEAGRTGSVGRGAIELHRLLPDATQQLGTEVRLDGTVVGDATRSGFWVRDLRDNVVFVETGVDSSDMPVRGDPVRVLGIVALLPLKQQAEHWENVQRTVPSSALVIRDVQVVTVNGGVEVLEED